MSGDGWDGMSHAEIVGKLSQLKPDNAFNLAQSWSDIYSKVSDSAEQYTRAASTMERIWTGDGPDAARQSLKAKYQELQADDGIAAKAGKLQNALTQDGACLTNAGRVPQMYPVPPDNTDKDAKQKLLEAVRAEAERLYTEPLDVTRPKIDDAASDNSGSGAIQQPGGGGGSGGGVAETPLAVAPTASRNPQAAAPTAWQTRTPSHNSPMETDKAGKGKGLAPDPAAVLAAAKAPARVRVQAVVHRLAPDPERAQAVPASRWGRPLRQATVHPDRLAAPASPRARPAVQARCAPAEDFRAGPPAAQVPTPLPSARSACAGRHGTYGHDGRRGRARQGRSRRR